MCLQGVPGDPRFPERDNEYVTDMSTRNDLLIQWVEDFRSRFEQYEEAQATLDECDAVLAQYKAVVGAVKIPLDIQNARNARTADGSCLEYGLSHHLERFKAALDKVIRCEEMDLAFLYSFLHVFAGCAR